ncbi:M48 family metallopeptidase [Accumulibacter sp.]|uniref:M48 family metallopeptidase n=1 Tax=Accumulibacter sp. TaxID=2053492 RepID=UPI0025D384F7|nr:SprT family zinc-dependent metalloprotease [Accumulibacter sp.]MCM8595794.1 M48 family metallopeptidase [Accumulibacter sp.]MCM8626515.1 M48 family metallopeptidase [Accumulibacter sp.]MDS4049942.1 SprT family zinc-dependent metalloprotease [Accumulibacter sp.]
MPLPPEAVRSAALPPAEIARSIDLGGRRVPYLLRRAPRRTIGLTIDHRGLRVGAPHRVTLREIESLIARHAEWINRKLDEWQARRPPERLQLTDGLCLPVLGKPVTIRLRPGSNRCLWDLESENPTLSLCLRTPDDGPRLLERTLREHAHALFIDRLAHYARQTGVDPPRLALSAARKRWGSCHAHNGIRLNWRLIHFPLPVIDYVVVHEVAHLREMNHSPRFWSIVAELYPDYPVARAALKQHEAHCPHW